MAAHADTLLGYRVHIVCDQCQRTFQDAFVPVGLLDRLTQNPLHLCPDCVRKHGQPLGLFSRADLDVPNDKTSVRPDSRLVAARPGLPRPERGIGSR